MSDLAPRNGRRRSATSGPSNFLDSLVDLIPAPLPAVTFTSLANLSVAGLCDKCQIVIDDEGFAEYLIERPLPASNAGRLLAKRPRRTANPHRNELDIDVDGRASIRTQFWGGAINGQPDFHGFAVHSWTEGHCPTNFDAALIQTAVDRAVALIYREQMAARGWPGESLDTIAGPASRAGRARRNDHRVSRAGSARLRLVPTRDA